MAAYILILPSTFWVSTGLWLLTPILSIHATQSVSAKSTIKLLQEDFAHFGFPHTVVTDCAVTFKSDEFQEFCKENGIVHLTGAPYHPATNGAAERLVQTFKQALKKSDKAPKDALQDFLRNYPRPPLSTGYSPSELLNGREIRTKIDTLLPSPAHTAQGKQDKEATKSQQSERQLPITQVAVTYKVGDPGYALYFGPRRDRDPRWVPAIVVKRFGTRSVNMRVVPRGPVCRRHIDQLQRRYVSPDDTEPGDTPRLSESREENPPFQSSSRATLRQRPPDNRRRHQTLARNMDRAILGDQNSRENLVNCFVVRITIFLPHRGGVRVVFSRTFLVHVWRKCRGDDCFFRKMIFIPRRTLICFARSVHLGRWLNTTAFLDNLSIRYALCSSTLLYSSRKRNCLPCLPLSSPNGVQCIVYKVLWVLKLCQGKTQRNTIRIH